MTLFGFLFVLMPLEKACHMSSPPLAKSRKIGSFRICTDTGLREKKLNLNQLCSAYRIYLRSCGVIANMLHCDNVVSEFEIQLRYYANFRGLFNTKAILGEEMYWYNKNNWRVGQIGAHSFHKGISEKRNVIA